MNHIFQHSNSKMYEKGPQYNESPLKEGCFPTPLALRYIGFHCILHKQECQVTSVPVHISKTCK